ncbi:putative HTH-type transcriptional regulator rrf2-like [Geobacter sp. OR-1]|uniref:RrF2 family transcriptional regulator n=1 Tax=Geobacter sp. OR-1 TaxID=1266765 RepID=UPI0005431923|nr:putative HTH-type transcriptional regulator rrf2-like [Geobacter sp. OR-1]
MRSKYAIKALSFMARSTDKDCFLIAELAQAENIPKKFLEAILLTLKSQGILASRKGPGGGYWLAKTPSAITLGSIIRAFEGDLAPVQCLGENAQSACPECHDLPTCATRLVMSDVQKAVSAVVDKVTLADMIERSEFERQRLSKQLDFSI